MECMQIVVAWQTSGNAWQYRCALLHVAAPHLRILVHHGTQHIQRAMPVAALYTGDSAVQQGAGTLRMVIRQYATLCAHLQGSQVGIRFRAWVQLCRVQSQEGHSDLDRVQACNLAT